MRTTYPNSSKTKLWVRLALVAFIIVVITLLFIRSSPKGTLGRNEYTGLTPSEPTCVQSQLHPRLIHLDYLNSKYIQLKGKIQWTNSGDLCKLLEGYDGVQAFSGTTAVGSASLVVTNGGMGWFQLVHGGSVPGPFTIGKTEAGCKPKSADGLRTYLPSIMGISKILHLPKPVLVCTGKDGNVGGGSLG